MKSDKELKRELESFQKLWKGGTARPKLGWEESKKISIFQDLDRIVDICISPYVKENTTVLEIGCGGGFWTQRMLNAKRIIGLDSLSAKHNNFWQRIGKQSHVKYFQVKDFLCKELEDNSIDYLFSYDVFCHISYSGAEAYLKNLHSKLKKGANCFIMIADADKYYHEAGREKLMKRAGFKDFDAFVKDYDGPSKNGRWYFYGTELFCGLLNKYRYNIISKDVVVEADRLNPIIHFKKEENEK